MSKTIRLTESKLRDLIKESVKQVLKETSINYDEDNFSGKYSKRNNDTKENTGYVFAFNVNDLKNTIYLYGKISVESCEMCQHEAERYGNGAEYVEFYEDENSYKQAINKYLQNSYTISNQ